MAADFGRLPRGWKKFGRAIALRNPRSPTVGITDLDQVGSDAVSGNGAVRHAVVARQRAITIFSNYETKFERVKR